jgi:cysteine synthase
MRAVPLRFTQQKALMKALGSEWIKQDAAAQARRSALPHATARMQRTHHLLQQAQQAKQAQWPSRQRTSSLIISHSTTSPNHLTTPLTHQPSPAAGPCEVPQDLQRRAVGPATGPTGG